MDQLKEARAEIDRIDREMAGLFEARMAAVRRVAEYKAAKGLPVLDRSREAEVITGHTAFLQDAALAPYYQEFLRQQMAISRQFQADLLGLDPNT